jgi:hypothetical protein
MGSRGILWASPFGVMGNIFVSDRRLLDPLNFAQPVSQKSLVEPKGMEIARGRPALDGCGAAGPSLRQLSAREELFWRRGSAFHLVPTF